MPKDRKLAYFTSESNDGYTEADFKDALENDEFCDDTIVEVYELKKLMKIQCGRTTLVPYQE